MVQSITSQTANYVSYPQLTAIKSMCIFIFIVLSQRGLIETNSPSYHKIQTEFSAKFGQSYSWLRSSPVCSTAIGFMQSGKLTNDFWNLDFQKMYHIQVLQGIEKDTQSLFNSICLFSICYHPYFDVPAYYMQ